MADPAKVLHLSLDAKAAVAIGPFARGGYSRTGAKGADHDFQPEGVLTSFGLYLVGQGPRVERVTQVYPKGVRRTKAEKKEREKYLHRKPRLEKWAITIPPLPPWTG